MSYHWTPTCETCSEDGPKIRSGHSGLKFGPDHVPSTESLQRWPHRSAPCCSGEGSCVARDCPADEQRTAEPKHITEQLWTPEHGEDGVYLVGERRLRGPEAVPSRPRQRFDDRWLHHGPPRQAAATQGASVNVEVVAAEPRVVAVPATGGLT